MLEEPKGAMLVLNESRDMEHSSLRSSISGSSIGSGTSSEKKRFELPSVGKALREYLVILRAAVRAMAVRVAYCNIFFTRISCFDDFAQLAEYIICVVWLLYRGVCSSIFQR